MTLLTQLVLRVLARLEQLAWLASVWEDIDAHKGGRPRRRYHRLTKEGAEDARIALARATTAYQHLARTAAPAAGGLA